MFIIKISIFASSSFLLVVCDTFSKRNQQKNYILSREKKYNIFVEQFAELEYE